MSDGPCPIDPRPVAPPRYGAGLRLRPRTMALAVGAVGVTP
ncbi:MAG: hypothetical protein AAFN30_07605 [Actinomycetota bacterium]